MTSLEEKELGAAAWTANDYPLAITHFTKAIELSSDKEFLKIVFSNRSVANLKIKKLTLALADADKCIELDGECNSRDLQLMTLIDVLLQSMH